MDRRTKPTWQKEIASERIKILFDQAAEEFHNDPKLSNRYVFLARKIAMKVNLKIPSEYKKKYCHKCFFYLVPGVNCVVRMNRDTKSAEYLCTHCKNIDRYGYSKEQSLQ